MSNIKTKLSFLSKEQCKNIIEFSNKNLELEKGKIFNDNEIQYNDSRKSSVGYSNYKDDYPNLVFDILDLINKEIKIKDCIAVESKIDLNFQFTKYEINEYFDWHTDSSKKNSITGRYFTIVIQLNDDYEGGDLIIKDENDKEFIIEKGCGNITIFPSSFWHKVTPIIKGIRYTLVNWYPIKKEKISML